MTNTHDTKNYTRCGPCPVCGKYIPQKRLRGLSRCEACKRKSHLIRSVANTERYRRKHGVVKVKGTVVNCIDCGISMIRNSITHIRCEKCRYENAKRLQRKYSKERRIYDPMYALRARYKNLISKAMTRKGFSKTSKTCKILGCTWEEFVIYIENQFKGDMGWHRIKEIHIDHKIPVSSARTEEDVIRLNHYTNFQPLWARDNHRKSNKLDYQL